jgi:hypothetical protein
MLAGFQAHRWTAPQAASEFSDYLHERWRGQAFIQQGKQIEQLELSHELYGEDRLACANRGEHDG